MSKFKLILKKIIIILINTIIYMLSLIIPKSEKIWIFGSWYGNRFSDNSRYLYLYCTENRAKLGLKNVIWITENNNIFKELTNNGFEVIKKNTLKSFWYHLRAKKHFIDQDPSNLDKYLSVRSDRIQLWHGVGFKDISNIESIPNYNSYKYKFISFIKKIATPGCWYSYIFLSTSKFATNNIFNLSFRLWENRVIECNYPRNIYLNNKSKNLMYLDEEQINIINIIKEKINDNKRIIAYFPTYRNVAQIYTKENYSYPFNIKNKEEFIKFDNYLEENNLFVISKFHFAGDLSYIDRTINFMNLPIELDIYPILEYTDIMITDYSSIYADYLFLNKPIIFYPYDLDDYQSKDKGFLFNYDDVTPGDKVHNVEELKLSIKNNLYNDKYKNQRNDIKNMYFGECQKDTFESVIEKIKSI